MLENLSIELIFSTVKYVYKNFLAAYLLEDFHQSKGMHLDPKALGQSSIARIRIGVLQRHSINKSIQGPLSLENLS